MLGSGMAFCAFSQKIMALAMRQNMKREKKKEKKEEDNDKRQDRQNTCITFGLDETCTQNKTF